MTATPDAPARPPTASTVPAARAAAAAYPGRRTLQALLVLAALFAVREARPLLAPVVLAVVLTFTLAPGVRWLHRRGLPSPWGALVLVTALLLGAVSVAAALARPAAHWWESAPRTVAQLMEQVEKLREAVPGLGAAPLAPARAGPTRTANPPADPLKEKLASEGVALTGLVLARGVSVLLSAAATVLLTYFLLASEHWLLSRTVEALPRRRTRALLLGWVRAAQRDISRYLAALALINATVGVLTASALWLLGLPNPLLWGGLTALLGFIPYLGPMVVMGLLLLAGITSFAPGPAVFGPMLAYLALHAVESNVVSPMVVGQRLSLSALSVFLSVLFWGWLWGVVGAVIAVPLLIGLRNLCRRRRSLRLLCLYLEGTHRAPPPSLRSLLRSPAPIRVRRRFG